MPYVPCVHVWPAAVSVPSGAVATSGTGVHGKTKVNLAELAIGCTSDQSVLDPGANRFWILGPFPRGLLVDVVTSSEVKYQVKIVPMLNVIRTHHVQIF